MVVCRSFHIATVNKLNQDELDLISISILLLNRPIKSRSEVKCNYRYLRIQSNLKFQSFDKMHFSMTCKSTSFISSKNILTQRFLLKYKFNYKVYANLGNKNKEAILLKEISS